MAHAGKLIEQAIVTVLVDVTDAGARVHRDRVDPFKKGELPAIAVYMPDEEVDQDASATTAPRELKRDADVEMQAFVGGLDAEAVADAMWDLQEQIENAMDANRYLAGTVGESILKSANREIFKTDGRGDDPLVGCVTLTYGVTFRTSPAPPGSTPTDDFLRADAKHKFVGAVDENTPEDTFEVRTP